MRQLPHKGGDEPPRSRTWSLSFTVSRHDPEEGTERPFSFVKRLTVLDLVVAVALLTLAVVEPFGVYMYLTRHGNLVAAESCQASGANVVVMHPRQGVEAVEAGRGDTPGHGVGEPGEVITPLNARNPSDLVMAPEVYEPASPPRQAAAPPMQDSVWDKVVESAAAGMKRAEPAAKAK